MNDPKRASVARREILRMTGLTGLAGLTGWSLTGCSGLFDESDGPKGGAKAHLRLTFVPVETLDPQVITNGMWILCRGVLEGLVVQNDKGDGVRPAVAKSWRISSDQLTYTFAFRPDAKWSNGRPVTAHDFERTYKRLFTPGGTAAGGTTLGGNAYQASTGIAGATEFLSGALKDWSKVGVHAKDARTLVLQLTTPNPDFLLALTHPAMLPLYMDAVRPDGKEVQGWQEPPKFVSNGPYRVTKWVKNSSLELRPNTHYWDRGNVRLDRVTVLLVEPTASGTDTVPYENNETDILPISDADVLRFQKDPALKDQLRSIPTYSIAYLAKLRSENPALEDVRVRRALSLGLGRRRLASVVPGARPGRSLVTDRTPGWTDSVSVPEDLEAARALLAKAGYPGGRGLPEVRILTGSTSPLVDAIADTWERNLGIRARADTVEAGVYTERRWQLQKGDYIGFYFGTFSGLPTWPTMVGTLWSPLDVRKMSLPGRQWARFQATEQSKELDATEKTKRLDAMLEQYGSPGSKRLADLVAKATAEPDGAERTEMFKRAARIREEEFLFIPVSWLSVYFAVRPTVTGLHLRPYPDFFHLKPIALRG